jgi:hypothetical protein
MKTLRLALIAFRLHAFVAHRDGLATPGLLFIYLFILLRHQEIVASGYTLTPPTTNRTGAGKLHFDNGGTSQGGFWPRPRENRVVDLSLTEYGPRLDSLDSPSRRILCGNEGKAGQFEKRARETQV